MLADLVAFTEYLLTQDLARATVRTYLAGLRVFSRWWEPQRRSLRSLSAQDVHRFVTWRLSTGGSAASVNRTLVALRLFCRWAKRCRRLRHDAMLGVSNLPVPRTARRLSPEALERLLDLVRRDRSRRDRAVLLLLIRGGLRPSQVVGLHVEDVLVGAERRELRLRVRGRARTSLLLDYELAAALQAHLRGTHLQPGELLFGDHGGPLSVQAVERLLVSYGRAAGVGTLNWRTLQRSLAQPGTQPSPTALAEPRSLLDLARWALIGSSTRRSPAFTV